MPQGYVWLFLLMAVVVFSLSMDVFFSYGNLLGIVRSVSIVGLLALANSFVILGGGIDLSVITISASTAMMFAWLFQGGLDSRLALLFALIYAALLGSANALLVTKGMISPFIVTLATGSVFNSLTERIGEGFAIYELGLEATPPDTFFGSLGRGFVLGVPSQAVVFIVASVASVFVLRNTRFGYELYATGANRDASEHAGINVRRIRGMTYVVSALLSGLAGLVRASVVGHAARTGATVHTQGTDLLDSIGAVLIGGTSLAGGVGGAPGTIAGSLIIGVLNNGMQLHGVPVWGRYLATGLVIIAAVFTGVLLAKWRPDRRRRHTVQE